MRPKKTDCKATGKNKTYQTEYEIYAKYKRMIRQGYKRNEAVSIIAQLNATTSSEIRKIIISEEQTESRIGESLYIRQYSCSV